MEVTKETRLESFFKTEPSKRQRMILQVLREPMTARQIANELGFTERNATQPRLSEMVDKGLVEVVGKTYDSYTKRNVAVYRKVIEKL